MLPHTDLLRLSVQASMPTMDLLCLATKGGRFFSCLWFLADCIAPLPLATQSTLLLLRLTFNHSGTGLLLPASLAEARGARFGS